MSSEWMENGSIDYFVGRDRHVNRIELVRHPPISTPTKPYRRAVQLVDVVNGLMHMHGLQMVHGDLKWVCIHFSQMKYLHTHISLVDEGEHPYQWGPAGLFR